MAQTNFISRPINPTLLIKRMLLGALIGFILIAAFLLSAGEGKLEWGNYWMIKPILMVPFAGSIGGAFNYFMILHFQHGWGRIFANVLSLVAFILGVWIGSVLGLNGTYWN